MAQTSTKHSRPALVTSKDLVKAVNKALERCYGEGKVEEIHPSDLNYLLYSPKGHSYTSFQIPKKSGGTRTISAPNPRLKMLLKGISLVLEDLYQPMACVMGFTRGRSVVHNANSHLGQNYVLNLDLKDFFPSISGARVYRRLTCPPYSLSKEVAHVIATACSMEVAVPSDDEGKVVVTSHVPQGSPASPVITNIICESLDRKLTGLAARFHLRYTRYADDITFSSMHASMDGENIYNPSSKFFTELRSIISQQGFTVNESKTRLQKKGSRQEVTGLTVGEKANVTRKYIRDLDVILYVWQKFGYEAAFARMAKDYHLQCRKRTSIPRLEQVVRGKLNYLRMVKGQSDPVYVRYRTVFDSQMEVLRKSVSRQGGSDSDVRYLATYSIQEFCEKFGTSITFGTPDRKFSSYFILNGIRHVIHVSKSASAVLARYGSPLDRSDTANPDDNGKKKFSKLRISLCRREGRCLWLMHNGLPLMAEATPLLDIPDPHVFIGIWKDRGLSVAVSALMDYHVDRTLDMEYMHDKAVDLRKYIDVKAETGKPDVKEVEAVISNLMNSENLTSEDRATLVTLISKEVVKEPVAIVSKKTKESGSPSKTESKVSDKGKWIHDPDLVVRFLKKFGSGNENHLKYCVHSWDMGEFKNYDDFIDKVARDLKSDKDYQNLFDCNLSLTNAIRSFILNSDDNEIWGDGSIKVGLQRPWKEISEWMSQNYPKQIWEMPLSVLPKGLIPNIIMGKRPSNFESVKDAFKATIEFRTEIESSLLKAINDEFQSSDLKLVVDEESLGEVHCYTYTTGVRNAFRKISENVRKRTDRYPELEVSCLDKDDSYEVHILQKDSFANVKLDSFKGSFSGFRTTLRSLCDFAIESRFLDENGNQVSKRIVYLDKSVGYSDDIPYQIEDCEKDACGFDHIFRFYK